jgi:hypothetical protein
MELSSIDRLAAGDQSTPQSTMSLILAADGVADRAEPSTWAMMLLGFAGLGFLTRRTARATA